MRVDALNPDLSLLVIGDLSSLLSQMHVLENSVVVMSYLEMPV